jgi:hypothetical protein
MMNWLIAASGSLFGAINEWTSRIPSVLSVFMTAITVYFMTGKWLRRDGRLFAALASLSMTGLIKKGSSAEIDSLFVFFVVVALLIWLNGYAKQWKPVYVCGIPLFILGFSFFTKGPQAIGFFYLTVCAYLLFRKRLSFLFSLSHLIGILCFALVVTAYLAILFQWISIDEYIQIWIAQIGSRAESEHSNAFLKHVMNYPVNVLLSFLPWVLLILPAIIRKDLRTKAKETFNNEILIFSLIMIAANFPLYWLLPNAYVRYFLPAGPFIAIILAGFYESYLDRAKENFKIHGIFQQILRFLSWAALLSVLAIPLIVIFLHLKFSLTLILLLLFFSCLAVLFLFRMKSPELRTLPIALAFFTGFCWLVYANFSAQYESQKAYYPKKIASEINLLLPQDIDTVYEFSNRFQDVTGYLKKEIKQIDTISQLKSIDTKKRRIYFIFDTKFQDSMGDRDKKIFYDEMQWEKVYSKKLKKGDGEIVVGYLK